MKTLRIATRKSALALWQAEHVADCLRRLHSDLSVELVGMTTRGDKILDSPLAQVGGKGLFVKELEVGLLEGRADIAVHSMKDVTVDFPVGLYLPVIMRREDPRDVFVSNRYSHPDELPDGACVGTCSLRRQCQLKARYPHFSIINLRGNVNTRLAKLDAGDYDAIILAAAGLKRLGMADRIACFLEPEVCLPAIGQGALGIECRTDDQEVLAYISPLNDSETHRQVAAERALNARMQGSCQVPLAGYAITEGDKLYLRGLVGTPDGKTIIAGHIRGACSEGEHIGRTLAEDLLSRGGADVLQQVVANASVG